MVGKMKKYILKRLLLIPITLFGIMLVNFLFIQLAPGGPVEQMMMKMEGNSFQATASVSGISSGIAEKSADNSKYQGAQGVREELKKQLENLAVSGGNTHKQQV